MPGSHGRGSPERFAVGSRAAGFLVFDWVEHMHGRGLRARPPGGLFAAVTPVALSEETGGEWAALPPFGRSCPIVRVAPARAIAKPPAGMGLPVVCPGEPWPTDSLSGGRRSGNGFSVYGCEIQRGESSRAAARTSATARITTSGSSSWV